MMLANIEGGPSEYVQICFFDAPRIFFVVRTEY